MNANIYSAIINLSTIFEVISLWTVRLIHSLITLNNYVNPIWIVLLALYSVLSALVSRKTRCPYCNKTHVIKYGYRTGKQRFLCHDCKSTYMHLTNTIMSSFHYNQSVWTNFIRYTLCGVSLDKPAKKYGFSHQIAFNMRHKILMALQDLLENSPVLLSGIAKLDETFVLDC